MMIWQGRVLADVASQQRDDIRLIVDALEEAGPAPQNSTDYFISKTWLMCVCTSGLASMLHACVDWQM